MSLKAGAKRFVMLLGVILEAVKAMYLKPGVKRILVILSVVLGALLLSCLTGIAGLFSGVLIAEDKFKRDINGLGTTMSAILTHHQENGQYPQEVAFYLANSPLNLEQLTDQGPTFYCGIAGSQSVHVHYLKNGAVRISMLDGPGDGQ